jgi:hypothetical protein
MEEVGHILGVLEKAKKAIKEEDVAEIKSLSNQTIHTASIAQDPDNIALAVILYSLSKLIERRQYQSFPDWNKFEKNYENCIDKAIIALKRKDIEVYREQINCIREAIKKLSSNLKGYIEEVFRKASINKASKVYEHGISLEKTAKILGITQWELSQYVGQAGISDVNITCTKDIKQRLKEAEEMFE